MSHWTFNGTVAFRVGDEWHDDGETAISINHELEDGNAAIEFYKGDELTYAILVRKEGLKVRGKGRLVNVQIAHGHLNTVQEIMVHTGL